MYQHETPLPKDEEITSVTYVIQARVDDNGPPPEPAQRLDNPALYRLVPPKYQDLNPAEPSGSSQPDENGVMLLRSKKGKFPGPVYTYWA